MRVVEMKPKPAPPVQQPDEMRDFMVVVRQALLMIVGYIERRYGLQRKSDTM